VKKAIPKTVGGRRPGAGRPATGKDPVRTMRLSDDFIAKVDAWATRQDGGATRSEAIRRLVELGLKAKAPVRPRKPGSRSRAQELARNVIEKMIDPTASPDERVRRRRRLTKGPLEFRDDRVDLPKAKVK
jgi:hypothetical protein